MGSGAIFGKVLVDQGDIESLAVQVRRLLDLFEIYPARAVRVLSHPRNVGALNDFCALDSVVLAAFALMEERGRSIALRRLTLTRALKHAQRRVSPSDRERMTALYEILYDLKEPTFPVDIVDQLDRCS